MLNVIIPIVVIVTGGAAWFASNGKDAELSPEKKHIFDTAMQSVKEPEKILSLAAAFDKAGHKFEANALRVRAKLRATPPEIQKVRREIFRKLKESKDPKIVEHMASVYEDQGATGAAADLKKQAEALRKLGHS